MNAGQGQRPAFVEIKTPSKQPAISSPSLTHPLALSVLDGLHTSTIAIIAAITSQIRMNGTTDDKLPEPIIPIKNWSPVRPHMVAIKPLLAGWSRTEA